ncbi:MAG: DUF2203 family protein [Pseudobdellovibrionaceae bacterium]
MVIDITKKIIFSLDEAKNLLPLLVYITEKIKSDVDYLEQQLKRIENQTQDRNEEIKNQIRILTEQWHKKVERTGAKAKGLWIVDFDNGLGYFCWKYPEPDIVYFHGYDDGFTGRKVIASIQDGVINDSRISTDQSNTGLFQQ